MGTPHLLIIGPIPCWWKGRDMTKLTMSMVPRTKSIYAELHRKICRLPQFTVLATVAFPVDHHCEQLLNAKKCNWITSQTKDASVYNHMHPCIFTSPISSPYIASRSPVVRDTIFSPGCWIWNKIFMSPGMISSEQTQSSVVYISSNIVY